MTDPLSNLPQEVRRFVEGLDFAMLQHSDDALVGVPNIRVGDYRAFRAELVRVTNELAALRARVDGAPVAVFQHVAGAEWRLNDSNGGVTALSNKPVRLVLDEGAQG